MSRKPALEGVRKDQFILFCATGESVGSITEQLDISPPTISKYRRLYVKEIEEKKNEISGIKPPSDKEAAPKVIVAPIKKEEKKDPKKEKPKFISVEDETARKTIIKASDSISTLKAQELKEDYQAAQVMHSASVRYKDNVIFMGLPWPQFIAFAIDEAYAVAVEAYKKSVDEALREQSLLEMEIEEQLENPEPKVEEGITPTQEEEA